MSKEMREQIDRVKKWKQFLNENTEDKGDKLKSKLLSFGGENENLV